MLLLRCRGKQLYFQKWRHKLGLLCTSTHSHWTLQTLTLNPPFHPFIPPSTVPHTHLDIWLQTPTSAPIIPPLAKLAFSPRWPLENFTWARLTPVLMGRAHAHTHTHKILLFIFFIFSDGMSVSGEREKKLSGGWGVKVPVGVSPTTPTVSLYWFEFWNGVEVW